ncbi:FKBP-type peptidyl-prolyl cis-trans isomerase [Sphingobacterium corticis]|uniref:peptidylprolyl isomerase n=1 Tax=Sphingobacterium corticis TaxID=1812823 RepID=A0ABW5NF13_9SPHI
MKKSILFLTAVAALAMTACQSFKKGDGGLEYKFIEEGSGEKATTGDVLAFNLIVATDRDSILANTYDLGLPQAQPVMPDSMLQGAYPGDPNSILRMLGEGDSAVFRINLDTMAARTGQPKPEFADKYIQFTFKVEKLFKKGDLADSVLFEQVNKYFEGEIEKIKNAEEGKINAYIQKNKLQPKKTASGLQYVIKEEGAGKLAAIGDTVVLNYTGSLAANDKMFDTNNPEVAKKNDIHSPMRTYEPIRVRVGKDPVIAGWTEGLQLLKKGSKATWIIPSSIGYGQQGSMGQIPQYAPLVFEVEVLDIIAGPKEEEAPQVPAGQFAPTTPTK